MQNETREQASVADFTGIFNDFSDLAKKNYRSFQSAVSFWEESQRVAGRNLDRLKEMQNDYVRLLKTASGFTNDASNVLNLSRKIAQRNLSAFEGYMNLFRV